MVARSLYSCLFFINLGVICIPAFINCIPAGKIGNQMLAWDACLNIFTHRSEFLTCDYKIPQLKFPPAGSNFFAIRASFFTVTIDAGRVDDLSFFKYYFRFCYLSIEFHCTFFHFLESITKLFLIVVFWLGCDSLSGLIFFMPVLLLSILMPLFLPSLSVSLSYFILAVPMCECLGKHVCMSSPFPIAILNGICFFPTVQVQMHNQCVFGPKH